jgi:hypothetical protein
MGKVDQNRTGRPPVWAEALLRALLAQRSRDAIAGDLLEEYRESVIPAVGKFRAQIWYVRQVISFLQVADVMDVAGRISAPLLWSAAAALVGYVLIFALPQGTGIPLSTVLFLFTGIVLIVGGATAIRTCLDAWSLIRTGLLGFICFGVVTAFVSSAQVFRPALIMGTFLIIVTATGFRGAYRTGQVRSGIAAAVAIGTAAAVLVVVTVNVLNLPHPPLEAAPVLPAMAAISGTIGSLFGKRFG